jgi:TRAP-type C4-dicarboxylate transport system substrate-binding protein
MFHRTATIATAAVLAAIFAASAAAEPIHLKFSSFEPPFAFGPKLVYSTWAKKVSEASDGTVQIDVYTGGSLGKPTAQLQVVENGVADMAVIIPSFTPGRFANNEIGELPFLWNDPTVAGIALTHMEQQGLLKYPGFKVLALDQTGPYQLHTTKPVRNLEDLKGMKIRAAGPIFGQVASALGAVPVGIPTPAVAENISRGVIDGAMNDWTLIKTFRILDVTHYHFEFPLGGVIAVFGMNQQKYNSLPPKAKAAIDKYSGDYLAKLWGDVVKEETKKVVAEVKANSKDTIVYPDAAEYKKWKDRLEPVVEGWASKSTENRRLLEAYKKELAAARGK